MSKVPKYPSTDRVNEGAQTVSGNLLTEAIREAEAIEHIEERLSMTPAQAEQALERWKHSSGVRFDRAAVGPRFLFSSALSGASSYLVTMDDNKPLASTSNFQLSMRTHNSSLLAASELDWLGDFLYLFVNEDQSEVAISADRRLVADVSGSSAVIVTLWDAEQHAVSTRLTFDTPIEAIDTRELVGAPETWACDLYAGR